MAYHDTLNTQQDTSNTKKIRDVLIDCSDISHLGETREFQIIGDNAAVYIEVRDDDPISANYYNFKKQTWSTTHYQLKTKAAGGEIVFPASSGLKKYTINVIAETIDGFYKRKEVRNDDLSINTNESHGSNSKILKKIIYQDDAKTLTISCISPSGSEIGPILTAGSGISSTTVTLTTDPKVSTRIGDLVLNASKGGGDFPTATDHLLITGYGAGNTMTVSRSVAREGAATLEFYPAFHTPTVTNQTISVSSGKRIKKAFSVVFTAPTGRSLSIIRKPTSRDICTYHEVNFLTSSAIPGEDTASGFYRWNVNNIVGLSSGMVLDPARGGTGLYTTSNSFIAPYISTTPTVRGTKDEGVVESLMTVENIPSISHGSNLVTSYDRNNKRLVQAGTIVFNEQQVSSLAGQNNVRIFGYDNKTGMNIKLSNVELTLTDVSTTVSTICSGSTTIALTELAGISVGSVVSGIGINSTVINPTVVSKSTNTGAGNITVSSAQTLAALETLNFSKSNVCTITGLIEISSMPIDDTTIYFDVERFLHCV